MFGSGSGAAVDTSCRRSFAWLQAQPPGASRPPSIEDYLSAEALELIHQQCSWSFDTFNYQRRSVSSLS